MKKTVTIKVDEALSDALQARSIELSGLERLIGFALSGNDYKIPQEKIDELIEKHKNTNAEYEILKEKISNKVIAQYGANSSWNLNFETKEATVEYTEE